MSERPGLPAESGARCARLRPTRSVRDGIVRISDIFEPALAELLEKALKDDTYWRLTYPDENQKRSR